MWNMEPELFLSQFVSQHMYKLAYLNETKFAIFETNGLN
jgi:hypothetical protein